MKRGSANPYYLASSPHGSANCRRNKSFRPGCTTPISWAVSPRNSPVAPASSGTSATASCIPASTSVTRSGPRKLARVCRAACHAASSAPRKRHAPFTKSSATHTTAWRSSRTDSTSNSSGLTPSTATPSVGELGIEPSTLLIGYVARKHPVKDHRTFLEAAGLLHKQFPEVRFVLCGDGATQRRRRT